LGINDTDEKSAKIDNKLGYFITVVGIPSAFLLHGYVGFIFGSIKANPWWSTVLMPIIFLFSAMVSGIALVMVIYMFVSWIRKVEIDMKCLDTIARYLLFILIIDFTLESLDQIHRIYEAEESFDIIKVLVSGKLNLTLLIMQVILGTIIPLFVIGLFQFYKPSEKIRKITYLIIGFLVLIGIFFMRWNVVIGGQLFSKSLSGFTSFNAVYSGMEGYLMAAVWLILPLGILTFLLWLMPPWKKLNAIE
jgi:formate-dependent nitrite reductase membrane component NrfD